MNASRFTLIAFVCLSLSDPPAEATAQQFDYRSQLGVVELGEQICLTIPNDKGKAGDIVHVIFPAKPQIHIQATIAEKVSKSCSRDPDTGPEDSFYVLQTKEQKIEVSGIGLGLVNYKSTLKLQDGLLGFNPHHYNSWEFLRDCASSEGLHLSSGEDALRRASAPGTGITISDTM